MMSTAASAKSKTFNLDVPEEAETSKQFECVVSASDGLDIKALQFEVEYDPDVVKFKKADFLHSANIEQSDKKGKIILIVLFDDVMTDGDVCTLSFSALAKEADTEIKLLIKEAVDDTYNDVIADEIYAVNISLRKRSSSTDIKTSSLNRVSSGTVSRSVKTESRKTVSSVVKSSSKSERKTVSKKADNSSEEEFLENSQDDTELLSEILSDSSYNVKYDETDNERFKFPVIMFIGMSLLVIIGFLIYREHHAKSVVVDDEDDSDSKGNLL